MTYRLIDDAGVQLTTFAADSLVCGVDGVIVLFLGHEQVAAIRLKDGWRIEQQP
jgi:hypothetical protein